MLFFNKNCPKMSRNQSKSDYFKVEKILDKRTINRRLEYLIKWAGYPESENTWEPAKNLASCKNVIKEFNAACKAGNKNKAKIKPPPLELPPHKTTKAPPRKDFVESSDSVQTIEMKTSLSNSYLACPQKSERKNSKAIEIIPESNEKSFDDKLHFRQIDKLNGMDNSKIAHLLRHIDESREMSKKGQNDKVSSSNVYNQSILEPQLTPLISNAQSNTTYPGGRKSIGGKLSKQSFVDKSCLPNLSSQKSPIVSMSNRRNSTVHDKSFEDKPTKEQIKKRPAKSKKPNKNKRNKERSKSLTSRISHPIQSNEGTKRHSSSKNKAIIQPLQETNGNSDVITITRSGSESQPLVIARCQASQRQSIKYTAIPLKQSDDGKFNIFSGFGNFEGKIDGHLVKDEKDWFRISLKCDAGWQSLGYFELEECRKRVPELLCEYYEKHLKINHQINLA